MTLSELAINIINKYKLAILSGEKKTTFVQSLVIVGPLVPEKLTKT